MIVSFRSIECCFLAGLMLCAVLSVMPVKSDVIVPYEWIVPGAYAKYVGIGPWLFYPNHTRILWDDPTEDVDDAFLEWTVMNRTGDIVWLNLTFFVEGRARVWSTESVPDGKVNILDVSTAAVAFGTKVYEWGFDPNADVVPDQKVNILDIATIAVAFGTYPGHPRWNPEADIAPEEFKDVVRHIVHHKNLLLNIDVSRHTFFNGEPWGKTCFWAEPYADINDTVVLYGLPPEEIKGTVQYIEDVGYWWPGVTAYTVEALQVDPFYGFWPIFDWGTGMAMRIYFQGREPINPECNFTVGFPNGTEYEITRFASTPIGTELNIGIDEYTVTLNSTNIQLGPPP